MQPEPFQLRTFQVFNVAQISVIQVARLLLVYYLGRKRELQGVTFSFSYHIALNPWTWKPIWEFSQLSNTFIPNMH